ncbi:MAG: DUF1385 domain-containing protein, partial [Bacillota bacterium]|nr:DUF1385 domain-containing protein [Bacillota bacterium]
HESGRPISVENARTFTTLHPRCGTSFVFFVLAISIIVFSMVSWGSVWQRVALKLVLFHLIAGVSYEMIKFRQLSFMTPFRWPGMMLQKLTTREPDDRQLEVAIAAFQAVLTAEDAPAPSSGETRVPSA